MEQKLSLKVPTDLDFNDLNLTRDPVSGDISFDWAPVEKICEVNQIDISIFKDQHEDNVGALLVYWYFEYIKAGGKPNLVAESLLAEISVEDEFGVANTLKAPSGLQ